MRERNTFIKIILPLSADAFSSFKSSDVVTNFNELTEAFKILQETRSLESSECSFWRFVKTSSIEAFLLEKALTDNKEVVRLSKRFSEQAVMLQSVVPSPLNIHKFPSPRLAVLFARRGELIKKFHLR